MYTLQPLLVPCKLPEVQCMLACRRRCLSYKQAGACYLFPALALAACFRARPGCLANSTFVGLHGASLLLASRASLDGCKPLTLAAGVLGAALSLALLALGLALILAAVLHSRRQRCLGI